MTLAQIAAHYVASAAPTYADAVLADSPIGYWRMGEASGSTLVDSSGNGRNGTYIGSPTLASPGLLTSDSDTAVVWSSTGKAGKLVDIAAFRPTVFSAELIIKPSSLAAGAYLFSKADINTGFGANWSWLIQTGTVGQLGVYAFTSVNSSGINITTGANVIAVGQTSHIVITYDGAFLKLYVNSSLVGSVALTGTLNPSVGVPVQIANDNRSNSVGSTPFAGTMDEVALYGTALSAARVQAHYELSIAYTSAFKPTSLSGLKTWYSAEAETGLSDNVTLSTWHDQSGNGNDAVATSTPKWRSASGPAGGAAAQFTGSGYFTLPNVLSGASAGEIFIKVKAGADPTGLWGFGQDTNSSDESHYPFSGSIYDSWGLATGKRQSASYSDTANWHSFHVWCANNDYTASVDGVPKIATAGLGAPFFHSAPVLGIGRRSSTVDLAFTGYMTTVLIFNRKLAADERARCLLYMGYNPSGGTP